jgi:hypothetical protein
MERTEKRVKPKYSVLVPTYGEEKNIKPLLTLIMEEAEKQ